MKESCQYYPGLIRGFEDDSHNKSAPDPSWRHLSGIDGNGSVLGTNADTHDKSCSKQAFPRFREAGTDWSRSKTAGSYKDFASSTKIMVEWIDDESTTA